MGYIIYTFDHTGHIIDRLDVVVPTDEDAVAAARDMRVPTRGRLEIWEFSRMVATIGSPAD